MNVHMHRWVTREPGVPVIPLVNWTGLWTLYLKEVHRFFKVQLQTIWAPALTTLLYLVIFSVALGRSGKLVMGVSFADFVAPGLIVMGMMQNAFANRSEEHTSELQSLMRISYAVFCLKKKNKTYTINHIQS